MADSNLFQATEDLQRKSELPAETSAEPTPIRIGRYRIEKVLGSGGFGRVYLAHDIQLDRQVAVKVPHARLIREPSDADLYLVEARTVASLDHPHIVPVYDVGSTDECPLYIVSKYIEGTDLATKLKNHRFQYIEAVEIVATIAAALHFAHKLGIVHRDVKPGNILIGKDGQPHLSDFGLALREEDIGKGPKYAGTPAYMSPEQARGEGHRVDGRSDVFSLGIVLYELLAGKRPFHGETRSDVLEQVTSYDPRPLRQYDERLPRELERICQKAISKRASERYSSAHDFAEDLRLFFTEHSKVTGSAQFHSGPFSADTLSTPASARAGSTRDTPQATSHTSVNSLSYSEGRSIHIIPKGLRSFDAHDADFFLELLPGPRDRNGIPDSLRFWKDLIEETDPNRTFSVGLIYGPSGCGKSSLVKAGLLPRLSENVLSIYVEATPEETESRLLHGLRKKCPALGESLSLKDTLAALRKGVGVPAGCKVLIVIDQFEQWLHANKEDEDTELVQALRQCNGERVQCIVMVRDDFWMAATRLMRELEVRLVEGQNSAAVDLFPVRHAEKVLAAFGSAFDTLPDIHQLSKDQKEFLKQSVSGLAEEGKVICVRLSLFAEMMKGKPWTQATLKQVGGTKGLGATFLEETFSAANAPPQHRYHQKAARAVLKALLPESGKDIKGQMKSADELLAASGYAKRTKDFAELIEILDAELRLITPTDPAGVETNDPADSRADAGEKYYQLTHDYLVHSLREWLNRKQKETRRGRAELRLAERASLWSVKPENRHLPSLWEFCNIAALTAKKNRSEAQQKMMRKAGRVHTMRWGIILLVTFALGFVIYQATSSAVRRSQQDRIQTAVASMRTSRGPLVPRAIKDLEAFPPDLVVEELRNRFADSSDGEKLALAYALAHFDKADVDYLVEQIPLAAPTDMPNIAKSLEYAREESLEAMRSAAAACDDKRDYRNKSRLAIIALQLGDASLAEQMCRIDRDSIQRTVFIDTLPRWHGNVTEFAELCDRIGDGALRSAVCLGIGSLPADEVTPEMKAAWLSVLSRYYHDQPDAGSHSAAVWALEKLNLVPYARPTYEGLAIGSRDWYVNKIGMTMMKIPAGSVTPAKNDAAAIIIAQPFWLADQETTVRSFMEFIEDSNYPIEDKPADWSSEQLTLAPLDEHPIQFVNVRDAMLFCNWLSHQDGLQKCYERTGEKQKIGDTEVDVWCLRRDADGYRLPSELEWEYACRAGAATKFSFGDDDSFLEQYAVYRATRPGLCARKMPNAWGLFDMQGNVAEICLNAEASSTTAENPADDCLRLQDKSLRGGDYFVPSSELVCPDSRMTSPFGSANRQPGHGFRVLRPVKL